MRPRDEPDIGPALSGAVRRAYVRPVDEDVASRHVRAMVAAASQAGGQPLARGARRPRHAWRPVLAGCVAAVLFVPPGLAAAGVSLPRAVERPYRAVGISLPNQPVTVTPVTKPAVVPGGGAATATTARPQSPPAASGSGSSGERRRAGSGASDRPSTSRAPATPPPASRQGTGAAPKTNVPKGPPLTVPKPNVPTRPTATPRKPVTTKPGARRTPPAKPARPVRPQTSPANAGPAGKPTARPGAPQNGTGRPDAPGRSAGG